MGVIKTTEIVWEELAKAQVYEVRWHLPTSLHKTDFDALSA